MKHLNVVSHFEGFQRDGIYVGKPCFVVNLKNVDGAQAMSVMAIQKKIRVSNLDVLFIGDDPLDQLTAEDINEFMRNNAGRRVFIETNGAQCLDDSVFQSLRVLVTPNENFNEDWFRWLDALPHLTFKLLVNNDGFVCPKAPAIMYKAKHVIVQPDVNDDAAINIAKDYVFRWGQKCRYMQKTDFISK